MSSTSDLDLVEGLLARDAERLREVIALYGGAGFGMARRGFWEGAAGRKGDPDTVPSVLRRARG